MKLWVLQQFAPVGWDEAAGFVIRAKDETAARAFASRNALDEGPLTWQNASFSSCEELTAKGHAAVVLRDAKAG